MQDEYAAEIAPQPETTRRKPVVALMGEFSAGKSTLTNLLIGDTKIPMRVTATQLPPVWLSYGTDAPYREDLEGRRHPIDGDSIDGIPVRDTAFIRLFAEAEVLEVCDIIDTPGISDPNMPAEVWQRAAEEADGVLWLTHANQAWRQSEAAVWSEMPEDLWPTSLLLVTRIDKIITDNDRARVLARIRREAGPMFRDILPISLVQALQAGDEDPELWHSSGGAAFSEALLNLITDLERKVRMEVPRPNLRRVPEPAPQAETGMEEAPAAFEPAPEMAAPEPQAADPEPAPEPPAERQAVRLRVVHDAGPDAPEPPVSAGPIPRRVARVSLGGISRPPRPGS